ncbi:sensor histidine kinase [Saccharicrinis fermentans]|uniref:histidine kinase n=1 Tax=Saccharicrinis fermentans DSM 9555 = JCM 21142 TaxID=869213 RepID=W7YKZ9_9BACT|nr:HAMP domain-containing sensor histidine kinase [Saccharicrinis fermentans]GAF05191.1 aerobic respiration control sensor protein ArcB [Saccharicrinis fermentans DSM 9555 = JCM 21142]
MKKATFKLHIIISLLIYLVQGLLSQAFTENKKILYINSYSIGLLWTDEFTLGLKTELDKSGDIAYYTEFMDTKRIQFHSHYDYFYQYLKTKYMGIDFDAVVTADNNALDFFLYHKDSIIFKHKPLIFAGINNIDDYHLNDIEAYGIVEGRGWEHVFYSMHRLFPDRKNVYVFSNTSHTDSLNQSIVAKYAQEFGVPEYHIIMSSNQDSMVNILKSLGSKDMVYLFNRTFSKSAAHWPYNDILTKMNKPLDVPIFSGAHIRDGINNIVGGEENIGEFHGRTAAHMVIKLLHGQELKPRFIYPKGKLLYNYQELKRFHIDHKLLPRDAIIVNKPESIFSKFKQIAYINFSFIAACVAIIITMIINNKNQKRYRKKIEEARDNALQSEAVKTSFIANISHEIRTPLNAIIGFSDILKAENKSANLNEYIKHIHDSSYILERLVNDVLDLSLIDSNEVKLNNSEVFLPTFTDELIKRNTVQLERYGKTKLKLRLKTPQGGPKILYTDTFRLNQILQNLINNSIKYSYSGTITLSYHFYTREEVLSKIKLQHYQLNDDQYCMFSVRDYGIGIPQELKTFVFERFRRLDQVYMGHHGGVGLGLNISKSIIKLMGGEIWFESKQGTGSTFSFVVPNNIPSI